MQEMTKEEIRQTISQARVGILSLARGGVAYAFPLFYAYRDGTFYVHSHPGTKDAFIEATEEAVLTIVRAITEDDWYSVQAHGPIRRAHLTDPIKASMDAVLGLPAPPELGETEHGEPRRSMKDTVFWMLEPNRLTGRKSQRPHQHAPDGMDVM